MISRSIWLLCENRHPGGFVCLNFVGVGDDFEGPFAPECFKVTPETDELFVHTFQSLDKSCEGFLS